MKPDLPPLTGGWPEFAPGSVWLAGAGPGDPGLVSLHTMHALNLADTVIYDALVDRRILGWARDGASVEYAGKRGGKESPDQAGITRRLICLARSGARVLRLKGGDPFLFGRGGEEALALIAAGIAVRIIPGITAAVGGLAAAAIPLTHRDINQTVTFLTGHDRLGLAPSAIDWPALARSAQVIVIYMGMKHLPEIAEKLLSGGRSGDETVAIISNATLPTMRVLETTLAAAAQDAKKANMPAPAIICIGRIVDLRRQLRAGLA